MDRRRTVAFWGLLLLLMSFWLWSSAAAQEAAPASAATPSSESTPTEASTPQAEKKRPKTMGELFLGKEGGPDATQVEPDELGSQKQATQGTLHLSDPQQTPQSWVARGEVGQSTFVDKLIQVCWSLALVSFLVWIAAKIAEKAGVKHLAIGATPKSMIEILERKRLSPGRSIMLIRVGPKVLAVAATEKGYETLTEFDGEQFKAFEDTIEDDKKPSPEVAENGAAVTPSDVLRHYLSIIPGTGAKK